MTTLSQVGLIRFHDFSVVNRQLESELAKRSPSRVGNFKPSDLAFPRRMDCYVIVENDK